MQILNAAAAGGYAVPGMCCYNMESIIATVRAAEAAKSPAMVLLFPWAIEYAGSSLVLAAANACHTASVPISLHLDHPSPREFHGKFALDFTNLTSAFFC